MFFILIGWLALCVAAGMFASIRRNRSGFGWFLFAFFFSPLLAFIFCAILDTKTWRGFKREAIARGEIYQEPRGLRHWINSHDPAYIEDQRR
jgi:hypothetical protein